MTKSKAIKYSQEELLWVKDNCALTRKELYILFCKKFKRTDVSHDNLKALCKRKGWHTGRTGHFEKGHVPITKGKKLEDFCSKETIAKIARTQFKKGNIPHNTKYLGHERIRKEDGYIEICISEPNKHTGYKHSYVLKHRYLWEQKNGKLGEGKCLKCLDGNRHNTNPDNWEPIDKATSLIINKDNSLNYEEAPQELKPTILALAKLKTQKFKTIKKRK